MTAYFGQLCRAMEMLSADGYTFVGQAVRDKGTGMSATFDNVPIHQRLEFPVMENTQMGFCTGIAMAGGKVCCVFPRINFMLDATSQLVQHLDKIPLFSDYRPRVIIRTAIATPIPLDAGPQHLGDYIPAYERMLETVKIVRLTDSEQIVPAYRDAMYFEGSTLLIEESARFI